jgi:hypothetical protein
MSELKHREVKYLSKVTESVGRRVGIKIQFDSRIHALLECLSCNSHTAHHLPAGTSRKKQELFHQQKTPSRTVFQIWQK